MSEATVDRSTRFLRELGSRFTKLPLAAKAAVIIIGVLFWCFWWSIGILVAWGITLLQFGKAFRMAKSEAPEGWGWEGIVCVTMASFSWFWLVTPLAVKGVRGIQHWKRRKTIPARPAGRHQIR